MFHTIVMDSPVGELRLIAGDRALRAILWGAEDAARLASINERDLVGGPNAVLDQAVAELEEYFAGTRRERGVSCPGELSEPCCYCRRRRTSRPRAARARPTAGAPRGRAVQPLLEPAD